MYLRTCRRFPQILTDFFKIDANEIGNLIGNATGNTIGNTIIES